MVTPTRAIALLVTLAILLAGPVSALASLSDCCCTEPVAQVDPSPADSCCTAQADQPADQKPCQDDGSGHCPGDCDCCVACTAVSPPAQMSRSTAAFDLPDLQPDAWRAFEPQSHAVEAHFSLLRPPRM